MHCESKKLPMVSFVHNLADLKNSFTVGFSKKFAIKSLSFAPPNLNYAATLPCEM